MPTMRRLAILPPSAGWLWLAISWFSLLAACGGHSKRNQDNSLGSGGSAGFGGTGGGAGDASTHSETGGTGVAGNEANAEGGAGGANACRVGERRCNGLLPEVCNAASEFEPTRSACSVACLHGVCVACQAGTQRCQDDAIETCDMGEWVVQEVCPASCQDATCVEGCAAGTTRCEGSSLQTCEAGEYLDTEQCDFGCQNGECLGECTPGELRCRNAELMHCSDVFVWELAQVCAAGCTNGSCSACSPGDQRCTEDGALETCLEDGHWAVQMTCSGDTPLCRTDLPGCGCVEGATRCSGAAIQTCDAGRWASPTRCQEGSCLDGACLVE